MFQNRFYFRPPINCDGGGLFLSAGWLRAEEHLPPDGTHSPLAGEWQRMRQTKGLTLFDAVGGKWASLSPHHSTSCCAFVSCAPPQGGSESVAPFDLSHWEAYGYNHSFAHPSPTRQYRSRWCRRYSPSCQNSTSSGITRQPYQCGGRSTSLPS